MEKADIGVIGLAVMGSNLALNMESKGFRVAVTNYEKEMIDAFAAGPGAGKNFIPCRDYEELVRSLKTPRIVFMMIKAGAPVDSVIEQLLPLLSEGDVIVDGGNSFFEDTVRRAALVESKGMLYVGTGVSGGEEGALTGPSLMPGGSRRAWPVIKPVFQAIAAKAGGIPCCQWIGDGGAGHFVKMVHNGIEYGDMELICEAYHMMKDMAGMSNDEMRAVFEKWSKTELDSYLYTITADILGYKDEDGRFVLDYILDAAGQKGTGKWTGINALQEGVPLTMISEAVFARCLSAMKDERTAAAGAYDINRPVFTEDREEFLDQLRSALYASKIISYAQGFSLMKAAADHYGWDLDYSAIAMTWRGGCIIRSAFLDDISRAFEKDPKLSNLLLDGFFKDAVEKSLAGWRKTASRAVEYGIPAPSMVSALSYFDGYTSKRLPANLIQAQRDYFGAHTYERTDRPRGEFFHTNWTGRGGQTTSSSYNV